MTEKTEKDIILFDDSNSYSFCYFYSGVFDKKDLEAKLGELYTKKFGEDAQFSYKITQQNKENTWFASVGCRGKDIVPDKINLPMAYFSALTIARKYKEEYLYVVVEESSSLMVFLCHNEPICSAKIGNKLSAISSDIGKDIIRMTEIFNKENTEPLKVEKLVFYGSLSQEQINLIDASEIKARIKEDKLDYSLYNSDTDLALIKEKKEEKNETEEIVKTAATEHSANSEKTSEAEKVLPAAPRNFVQKEIHGNIRINKFISTLLAALILGAGAFPAIKLFIKSMNFYSDKLNANVETLKTSSITELPAELTKEITDRTTFLNTFSNLTNYDTDIFKNTVDTTLFGNSEVKISNFKIEEGIYVLTIEVASEKDLESYLAKIIFSNKLVLEGAPTEISAGKSYELRIIPVQVF